MLPVNYFFRSLSCWVNAMCGQRVSEDLQEAWRVFQVILQCPNNIPAEIFIRERQPEISEV
jgi:hypothetical protein